MSDELMELPEGWTIATLRQVSKKLVDGSHAPPPKQANGLPMLSARNIENGKIIFDDYRFIDKAAFEIENARTEIRPGDVLLTIVGAIGRAAVVPSSTVPFTLQRSVAVIKLVAMQPEFCMYQFLAPSMQSKLIDKAKGTAQKGIYLKTLNELEMLIPPLNEQKRIVAAIAALRDRTQKAREALEAIPALCDKFRQSVLAAAFRGDLTADWREQNPDVEPASVLLERIKENRKIRYEKACVKAKQEKKSKPRKVFSDEIPQIDNDLDLPSSWTVTNVEFSAHVTKLAGFEYTKHIVLEDSGEVPTVRAQNVQMGEFIKENVKYISKETSDYLERSQLHGREILMVFIGAGTGNVCLAPPERWHLAPNVAKLDVDGIYTSYLLLFLQSPTGQKNTLVWAKATAQPSLSMETIRKIEVYLPPLEEQKEIVLRIQKLLDTAARSKKQYEAVKAQLEKLDRSILAKAFRGELVEQDPNDEPASALLERIRAEREKLAGEKEKGKRATSKGRKASPKGSSTQQMTLLPEGE